MPDAEESFFYEVYDAFREFSAIGLMNMTHREKPWTSVGPHNRGTVIPQELMKAYFKTQIVDD